MSPYETIEKTSAELATLGTVWTAIQARTRFMAHMCQRLPYNEVPDFLQSEDRAGMIALVYGLLSELLCFDLPTDTPIDTDLLQIPDLESAPSLGYCVISGLNLLENNASDGCQYLRNSFQHVENCSSFFRIMFTTSGRYTGQSSTR